MCNEYSHVKNDLSLHDGVIIFRNRIVIPSEIRPNILNILHSSHNGMVSMKAEARQTLWWPNISNEDLKNSLSEVLRHPIDLKKKNLFELSSTPCIIQTGV